MARSRRRQSMKQLTNITSFALIIPLENHNDTNTGVSSTIMEASSTTMEASKNVPLENDNDPNARMSSTIVGASSTILKASENVLLENENDPNTRLSSTIVEVYENVVEPNVEEFDLFNYHSLEKFIES
ncbi:hypothetical protein ACH5RR_036413 [Cinchona calisaya]|uniref:Uncharacterized protein n=1 Tax=Cinchona calisaya TaxID=153742 RepID=A0ABD2Y7S6_9GENT